MNTREKVLKEALNCVNGEREKQYGNPEDNFQRIADFWGLYLTTLFEDTNVVIELDPKDVAVMMVLFKIARSLGDEDKLDNYVDIIGYAACGAEIFEKEATRVSDLKKEIDAKLDEANDSYQYFMEKNFGKGAVAESRSCSKKASDNIRKFFEDISAVDNELMLERIAQDPYSYYHDKLAYYVSIIAKEKNIPLDNLKSINRKFPRELEELLDQEATDCAINGKQLRYCYKEIRELFDEYDIPDKEAENTDTKESKRSQNE